MGTSTAEDSGWVRKIHQWGKRSWLWLHGIRPLRLACAYSPNAGNQAWHISPKHLNERPLVFSLGLAENLSFDLGMIQEFAAVVHGFDPTPVSREFVEKTDLPTDFHYHAVAVAGHDGWIDLIERHGKGGKKRGPVFQKAPCLRLTSILKNLQLEKIDVLKMDIEGSEYGVFDDILPAGILPTQIAVEFHHRFEEIGIQKTRRAHQALERHGYRLAHLSPWSEEFLYIRLGSA